MPQTVQRQPMLPAVEGDSPNVRAARFLPEKPSNVPATEFFAASEAGGRHWALTLCATRDFTLPPRLRPKRERLRFPFDRSSPSAASLEHMDVERIINDIEQLREMFEAPDIRPLTASDISAANRRHDEKLAHSPWFKLWQQFGVCCRTESPTLRVGETES